MSATATSTRLDLRTRYLGLELRTGSSGGASYSASICFQILLARFAAFSDPSCSHCSKLLLSAMFER